MLPKSHISEKLGLCNSFHVPWHWRTLCILTLCILPIFEVILVLFPYFPDWLTLFPLWLIISSRKTTELSFLLCIPPWSSVSNYYFHIFKFPILTVTIKKSRNSVVPQWKKKYGPIEYVWVLRELLLKFFMNR